jgi:hypothetical protein
MVQSTNRRGYIMSKENHGIDLQEEYKKEKNVDTVILTVI